MFSGGVTSVLRQKRSYYGDLVNPEEYPYVVRLYNNEDQFYCAGSIINSRLILTVAHCIEDSKYVAVFQGSWIRYNVRRRIAYSQTSLLSINFIVDEIALLLLEEPIKNAQVIRLPPRNFDVPPGAVTSAIGLGVLTKETHRSNNLRKVDLPITDAFPCTTRYENAPNWICTDSHDGCVRKGDFDGGPLVWDNSVVGIVSWGDERCRRDMPSVFTKVSGFWDWIDVYISVYE
ncbi:hypothetical protein QAD02_010702 [Eretmocerus hayati]|uniref:Uncharacterized protein n=1 Tax=Eretmocerus hayati TaxID=131215 RepID=A0ACC2NUT2_9HYME|nr:hypothetical protein QAD02_010702 [Eretmocerus hayati]